MKTAGCAVLVTLAATAGACFSSPAIQTVQVAADGHYFVRALGCLVPIPAHLALNTGTVDGFRFSDPDLLAADGRIWLIRIRAYEGIDEVALEILEQYRRSSLTVVRLRSRDPSLSERHLVIVHDGIQQLSILDPPDAYVKLLLRECRRTRDLISGRQTGSSSELVP